MHYQQSAMLGKQPIHSLGSGFGYYISQFTVRGVVYHVPHHTAYALFQKTSILSRDLDVVGT